MKKQDHNNPAHGSHVFTEPNMFCECELCLRKREAVDMLAQGFDSIPSQWMQRLMDGTSENHSLIEGSCFISRYASDLDRIQALFWEDTEEGAEEYDPGWFLVGKTGFLGREYDGKILIVVDDRSDDFFTDQWEPFYDALGYIWHQSPDYLRGHRLSPCSCCEQGIIKAPPLN